MYVSIGKAAQLMGVSPSTLRRWDKAATLPATFRTPGNHRRYKLATLLGRNQQLSRPANSFGHRPKPRPRVVTYARVSGSKQRSDLQRQMTHLQEYAKQKEWTLVKTYKDIGSGLNDQRPGLLRLLRDLPVVQPDWIVCTYEDRLARFGTKLIQTIGQLFSTQLHFTKATATQASLEEQVTKDVIAVVTSFAGKLHRARRGTMAVIRPP